ncbi:hypothetical protein EBB07_11755 [Paenibacillaceae bacterium]|nr:hypothetical protein EBB07_11755 [Paenibacillaceae bacterium]
MYMKFHIEIGAEGRNRQMCMKFHIEIGGAVRKVPNVYEISYRNRRIGPESPNVYEISYRSWAKCQGGSTLQVRVAHFRSGPSQYEAKAQSSRTDFVLELALMLLNVTPLR